MIGWFACFGLTIYWGRAWLHLLDTVEAVLTAYKWSDWTGLRWLEALVEIPIHIFSEPVYCLQIAVIGLVFALTVNKNGYHKFGSAPARSTTASGSSMAAIFLFLKR